MKDTENIPRYQNYKHYIHEGWSEVPKFTFQRVVQGMKEYPMDRARVLDVGCATGEFIGYMASEFPTYEFMGIDIFDELITKANEFLPEQEFVNSDYLELPKKYDGTFDLITAVGVLSLFGGDSIDLFWEKTFNLLKPGGRIFVLGPVNEFGVDMDLKHRKWIGGERGEWERGWSIPSRQTIEHFIKDKFSTFSFENYEPKLDLEPREDPIRTWTVPYKGQERQLTNGLKLLVNYNFIEVQK